MSIWSSEARARAAVFVAALWLGGCGFQPIYKYQAGGETLSVAELVITGDGPQHALARHLDKAIGRSPTSPRVQIKLTQTTLETQKSADGIARRLQVTHRAAVTLNRGGVPQEQVFTLTQYMTRSDSAADELTQRRALSDLAARELADQIIVYLMTRLEAATQ